MSMKFNFSSYEDHQKYSLKCDSINSLKEVYLYQTYLNTSESLHGFLIIGLIHFTNYKPKACFNPYAFFIEFSFWGVSFRFSSKFIFICRAFFT